MPLASISVLLLGAFAVAATLRSALHTLVLPRSAPDPVLTAVFWLVGQVFRARVGRRASYERQDRVMALYAPVALVALPLAWIILAGAGFTAIYWALGVRPAGQAARLSGSSILTLGFVEPFGMWVDLAVFLEAAIGLGLMALLIAYLPTMYGAFSRRESAVTLLEVRAGSPPSSAELLERAQRIGALDRLPYLWRAWEAWFADVEESHTSFAPLVFFRSTHPGRSWVTAVGAVLDAASLYASTVDRPRDPAAELCIRAGYIALRRIADFFRVPYDPDPAPTDPISVSREEYDAVVERLIASGLPIRADRDAAWASFAGWRVNYDTVLLALAELTMAPYAPWSSDRGRLGPDHPSGVWPTRPARGSRPPSR